MAVLHIRKAWLNYSFWLERNAPELHALLLPPVSEKSLQLLETTIGRKVASDVIELWRVNNGQRSEAPGIIAGFAFLSAEDALKQWRQWADLRAHVPASQQTELNRPAKSIPPGCIQCTYTHSGWLPLWKEPWEGNYMGVDLSPGPRGCLGQIINFGRDEDEKVVLADSLTKVVAWLAEEADRGSLRILQVKGTNDRATTAVEHASGRLLTALRRVI